MTDSPSKNFRLTGVIPALTTPFHDDQSLDLDGFSLLLDQVITDGVDGVVVNGCTGESWAVTDSERAELFRVAVDVSAGRVPIVGGCSGQLAPATRAKIDQAQAAGCVAAMVSPPWYIMPGQDEIGDYYDDVLADGDLSILLYNIPRRTGVQLGVDLADRLADHPRVIAIKESSKDWGILSSMIRRVGDRIDVLAGYAAYYGLAALTEGAKGYIDSATPVLGTRSPAFYRAATSGDVATARKMQADMAVLLAGFFGVGTFPAGVKAALDMLGRPGGRTRDPIRPLDHGQRDQVRDALIDAGLLEAQGAGRQAAAGGGR